jgi:hypothetical protein
MSASLQGLNGGADDAGEPQRRLLKIKARSLDDRVPGKMNLAGQTKGRHRI